jgi:hypothetical protein
VRLGTVEQGMFDEKSLDPDMNGDLGNTNLEQTASWLSCEVRGETRAVAIFDLATEEEEKKKMMMAIDSKLSFFTILIFVYRRWLKNLFC